MHSAKDLKKLTKILKDFNRFLNTTCFQITCTVHGEIFASENFSVLNFRSFYFRNLAKWQKIFYCSELELELTNVKFQHCGVLEVTDSFT